MKIKFHHILAFFIVTLFFDFDLELSFVRLRIIDFFLVGLMILMILSAGQLKTSHNAAAISLYVLIIYILLNGIFKVELSSIIKEVIQLVEYVLLMHLIAEATNEPQKRKEFLDVLFWGAGCVAVYSMMYNVVGGKYANYKDLDAPKHSFAFFALLAVVRFFSRRNKNLLQLGIVFFSLALLLLSGERKGWAGFAIGFIIFTYLQVKSSLSKKNINAILSFFVIVGSAATIGIITLVSLPQFHYLDRQLSSFSDVAKFFSDDHSAYASGSDEERIFMLEFGLQTFQKHPVTGIGVDEFNDFISRETHGYISHDAHNFYLKMLVENGIIGMILFLIPLALIFSELWKLCKHKMPHISRDARIVLAIFFLGSVVNFFLAGKALSWLYVILPCGLILGINRELIFQRSVNKQHHERKSKRTGSKLLEGYL